MAITTFDRFLTSIALLLGMATGVMADGASAGLGMSTSAPRAMPVQEDEEPIITIDLTHRAADLWDRIRRGFGMPDLVTDEVTERQITYLSHPAALQRLFERSYRYLYHIVDELEERGLPTEIALLPMVESGFDPMAYSRSRAAGLWQFVPSTGRYFNLRQNAWIDERRDVIASTDAALDYLERIYDMQGDWQLALASYNAGEGTVLRARQRNEAKGLPTDYVHLPLRKETREYIPKLQALKNIIARPELFGIELPHVPNRVYFDEVETPPGIDLALVAKMSDTPLDELVALNPAYRKPVIPDGKHQLLLPADKVSAFRAHLDEAKPRWKTYQLRRKDSLAKVARRFGLTLTQLMQINGLRSTRQAKPGMALLVPAGAGTDISEVLPLTDLLPDLPSEAEIRRHGRRKRR
ncbi:transglycosylase SLT domain-containing protein [Nitrogeniibacter mangrovi]|uniref:Transglycosylase SLT domain-containing protein n=1 Tax=Nitrogeniibacter mangrovi TaxID=2016596 RepID=A0A6C1B356_9RHOO|nr:transglycosylase SLT domain-containing protein [Nitrogeniibacter mangrovi]QID18066.1 transglycosylase SLT domain-containing protein [Nitrogeniibacter mangrovi]